MKPYRGPPMTLDAAAAAQVRLIVWCHGCGHQVEPDLGQLAEGHSAEMPPVLDWRERLVCSECGGREVDFAMTGTECG
jgi:rubredoxin